MDLNRLNQGEKIAGIAGIILFISLFLAWYGGGSFSGTVNGVAVNVSGGGGSASGWQSLSIIDLIIALTAIAAIASAVLAANQSDVGLPVAMSSVVAGLGAFCVLLILFRIIDKPFDAPDGVDIGLKWGIFVSLIAAGAVTYGGYLGMQEEGNAPLE
jgi:hypothetical protein